MMLEYIGEPVAAKQVRDAVCKTLENAETRTGDLGGPLNTEGFTEAILSNLK